MNRFQPETKLACAGLVRTSVFNLPCLVLNSLRGSCQNDYQRTGNNIHHYSLHLGRYPDLRCCCSGSVLYLSADMHSAGVEVKSNNHPIVRDLRRMLARHDLQGVVLVGVRDNGHPIAASAGSDVEKCNALGPVLEADAVDILKYEIDIALMSLDQMEMFE